MEGRHQFPITVKRNLAVSRTGIPDFLCRNSFFISQVYHCCFCRISDLLAFHIGRIIAENAELQHLFLQWVRRINLICRNIPSIHIIMFNGHPVLCQCSRFVRTNYRYTSQPFHRLQFPYDCSFFRHLSGSKRQHNCYNGTKCFRNRRHSQCHCKEKCICNSSAFQHLQGKKYST